MLKRGAHVDDRDGLTGMTLLHYTAKSGALGNEDLAYRWALHFFEYFSFAACNVECDESCNAII